MMWLSSLNLFLLCMFCRGVLFLFDLYLWLCMVCVVVILGWYMFV